MTIVLIDDDISDIEYCKKSLSANFDCFETPKWFTNPVEGLDYLNEHKPDLLIVDVEMPEMTGLDLLKRLRSPNTEVIFSTAHDKFAIEAYRNFALGFLLKPYSQAEFIAVISKAVQRLTSGKREKVNSQLLLELLTLENKKIAIPTLGCTYFSNISDVIRLESVDGYAKIYLEDGNIHLSSYGIRHFENSLTPPLFFRAHKSHLINIKKIKKFFPDGTLILESGERIPVARRRRTSLLELFNAENNGTNVA